MGYKVKRKIFKLSFQGTDWDGLEVVARSLNTGQFIELRAAQATSRAGGDGAEDATGRMLELLAGALIEWNAEDEDTGQPIPPTLDGLHSQDLDFTVKIIDVWTDAIAGVRGPLRQTSSDGQPSLEASIPMDVPSESLAS
jgi:hypothetical protein